MVARCGPVVARRDPVVVRRGGGAASLDLLLGGYVRVGGEEKR